MNTGHIHSIVALALVAAGATATAGCVEIPSQVGAAFAPPQTGEPNHYARAAAPRNGNSPPRQAQTSSPQGRQ